jgi:putative transcriptional regulator
MLEITTNLTHHFLIAMPSLKEPTFYQTVTYICAHNKDGAMGIVINRPINIILEEVLKEMDIKSADSSAIHIPIFDGGPVQPERGFVIHEPVGQWEGMFAVDDNVGITTSRDILNAIANGKGPKKALIALGYAGWDAGQLEKELMENTWLSVPADNKILFHTPPKQRWRAAATSLGIDLTLLSCTAGHA